MAGFPTALKSQSLHPYLFNVRTSEKWVKDCNNGFAANSKVIRRNSLLGPFLACHFS